MTGLIVVELAAAVLGTVIFLLGFGRPWKARDTGMAWHIASFTAATGVEMLSLLLLALHVPIPVWTFAVIFAAVDLVIGWRLALLLKAREKESV